MECPRASDGGDVLESSRWRWRWNWVKARVSRGNQKLGTGTGTGLGLPIFAVGYISSSVFSLELVAQLYLLRAVEPMWSVDGIFSHVSRNVVDHHHDHRRLNMMAWANDDDVDEKRNWESAMFFLLFLFLATLSCSRNSNLVWNLTLSNEHGHTAPRRYCTAYLATA